MCLCMCACMRACVCVSRGGDGGGSIYIYIKDLHTGSCVIFTLYINVKCFISSSHCLLSVNCYGKALRFTWK